MSNPDDHTKIQPSYHGLEPYPSPGRAVETGRDQGEMSPGPSLDPADGADGAGGKRKSKPIALLLCLFGGWAGLHHIYVGNNVIGFTMLAISAFLIGTLFLFFFVVGFFGFLALAHWLVIDMILIATGAWYFRYDEKGRELTWAVN